MIDWNAPRRTKDGVHAEWQAKAARKVQLASERMANISKVAAFERADKQKAVNMSREGNDPMGPALQARAKTGRMRAEDVTEGASALNLKWTWTEYYSPLMPSS
jgi:hypothetical protein